MDNNLHDQIGRLYHRLKTRASQLLSHEQSAQTLQTTMVVNDALHKVSKKQMSDGEFLTLASQAMRQVVIDHIRKKYAIERGGPGRTKSAAEEEVSISASGEAGSRTEYDPSDPSMAAFLAYEASESTRDQVRRANGMKYGAFLEGRRQVSDPSAIAMSDEQIAYLHDGLEQLYEDDQKAAQIIDMVHFGEMSFQDIADAIGSGKTTVSDRYHRGLKMLRAYFDEGYGTA